MLQIKWLKRDDKDFLDLVAIINDVKNKNFFRTEFVSCLLNGYWSRYYERIFQSQFCSFMIYQVAMTNYLVLALRDDYQNGLFYDICYFPLAGFTFVFICNQFSSEFVQWKESESNKDYFMDYWNMNDLTYLLLNLIVLVSNTLKIGPDLEM